MTQRIRVMLADDHAVVRAGLRMLLDAQDDIEIVAEVERASDVLPTALRTGPHVVVLDLTMPDGGGLAALEDLRRSKHPARAMVLTMHESAEHLRSALQAGALGYVTKRLAGQHVVDAVRAVAAGRMHIDAGLGSAGLTQLFQSKEPNNPLSVRESEVLKLVAEGHTNREAGELLGISTKTIEAYRARLSMKLDATNRVDLVKHALRLGLLKAP